MYQTSRTLGVTWSDLIRDRLFVAGLVIKLILIFAFIPTIQTEWFVPFVVDAIENPSFSPWSSFINSDKDILAFPYGPIMLLAHLPTTFLGWVIDSTTGANYFSGLGFRLSLLGADMLLLILLLQQFESRWRGLLIHYWLSPLVLLITYWHGQTDLIPIVLFMTSIILLKKNKLMLSGMILAVSVAAKHSMLITMPFILIYSWFKRNNIKDVYRFVLYFLLVFLLFEGLFLFDYGFQQMVLSNREAEKVFWLAISMGDLLKIYILPLVYLLLVYLTWRLRRINFELLLATLGVAFSVLILLTPAPPGWFLWLTPVLALHYSRGNGNAVLLGSLFSLAFVMYHSIYSTGAKIAFFDNLSLSMNIINFFDMPYIQALLNTTIIGLVMVITLQIFRDGIKGSDYYHLGKKPLVIGISGADNSGKLNFVEALTGLFGKNKVLTISGENYFNWDKHSPMWQAITSSNPHASNIFLMISDLRKIISGEWIKRRVYNRDTGLFSTEKIHRGHQVIIVSGLHALHTKQLVEIHDVKFFLANKDDNHKSVKNVDFEKYIQPQQKSADIIFEAQTKSNKNIDLTIRIRDGVYYQELFRVLIGICGLQMEVIELDEYDNVELIVQGEIQSVDIRLAANVVTPNLSEFIDQENGFYGGTIGVMQLVALMEIDEVLKRRRAVI